MRPPNNEFDVTTFLFQKSESQGLFFENRSNFSGEMLGDCG